MLKRKIIKKGIKFSYKIKLVVNPEHNNLNSINIEIYEGENIYIKDNYPLEKKKIMNKIIYNLK